MRPEIVLVVAVADNKVIGHQGGMPWHAPADLKRFKRMTVGKPVVMGRRTFESIGKPLPGRHNIVLTRNADFHAPGVTKVGNIAEAIAAAGLQPNTRADQIMVIGGAEIFAQWLPLVTHVELTELRISPPGDTFWPGLPAEEWEEVAREDHPAEAPAPALSFVTLRRREQAG